ncbi:MAG: sigma-70 family RNA polymerase sigma factor [Phycisphaerae bacterium]
MVQPLRRPLYLSALQYVSESDAADLVQEALLRAWRNFAPSDERTYRRAWLFVILRNVALEWRRTAARRVRLVPVTDAELTDPAPSDLSEPPAPFPPLDEQQFREFLDQRIVAALDGLEPPYREVLVLSVAGGLSYREIGDVLDCPLGTVMSRMARARGRLRERLADYARSRNFIGGKAS